MKRNKIVCLDEEVVDFLRELNASELVNRLVQEYMEKDEVSHWDKARCLAEIEVNKLKKATEKKIKEMRKNAGK